MRFCRYADTFQVLGVCDFRFACIYLLLALSEISQLCFYLSENAITQLLRCSLSGTFYAIYTIVVIAFTLLAVVLMFKGTETERYRVSVDNTVENSSFFSPF